MFTKRHEQELAEIKALTYELDRRLQEVLEQLQAIQEGQEQPVSPGPKQGKRRGARKRRNAELAQTSGEE